MTDGPRSAVLAEPWPVVLLHGTRTSHSQWDPQVPSLRAAAPHGHLEKLPYGDHMLNLNAAHRFIADLLRVLARAQSQQVRAAPSRAGEARGPDRP